MSIKIENLIKLTASGSYMYLTPEEYHALTAKPTHTALKDIQWNGPTPELAKDQRIYELEVDVERLLKIRDNQKGEIQKLREEVTRLNDENYTLDRIVTECKDKVKELESDLDAMTLKAKGMVEKPYWKDFPLNVDGPIYAGIQTDHGTAEVLRELLAEGDTSPIEPTPVPEPNEIAEVIPEPETVPEPVFNDTAVTAEEVTSEKYPAKKKKGPQAKNAFTPAQTEKYRGMVYAGAKIKEIISAMMSDTGISEATARSRYYIMTKSTTADPMRLATPGRKSSMTAELRDKYVGMIQKSVSRTDIEAAIAEELKLGKHYATKHYKELKLKADSIEAIKDLDARTKIVPQNPVTLITTEARPSKMVCAELEALPDYGSLKEFKNACCRHPILRSYNIIDLKGQYKSTHKNLTW